jgi:hypothetical protein
MMTRRLSAILAVRVNADLAGFQARFPEGVHRISAGEVRLDKWLKMRVEE